MIEEDWSDHVVLVTGGTKGIGRAAALQFLDKGATVVGTYRSDDDAADGVKNAAWPKDGTLELSKFDVSDQSEVADSVSEIFAEHGEITHLVNNAGILAGYHDPLQMIEEDDWDRVLDVNLKGMYNVSKCVLQETMRLQGRMPLTAIVNVSSVGGLIGTQAAASYTSSKAGILGLSRTMAKELARHDVRVNSVVPGYTRTPLVEDSSFPGRSREEILDDRSAETLKGRFAVPDEIANVIVFLASEQASYVTGASWEVDGGRLIH